MWFCLQVLFGMSVLLMLWAPVQIIRYLFPSFLPYNVMLSRCVPRRVVALST